MKSKLPNLAQNSVKQPSAEETVPAPASTDQIEIVDVARSALQDATEIVVLIELMRIQNTNNINSRLAANGAGNAAMAIRNSILTRLTLLVSRAYSDAREGDRHLHRAFSMLKDNGTRQRFDQAVVVAAENAWSKCRADHRAHGLKVFRDKHTAHIGDAGDNPLPSWSDVFAIANLTVDAMQALAFAVGIKGPPVRENIDAAAIAKAFWKPWSH